MLVSRRSFLKNFLYVPFRNNHVVFPDYLTFLFLSEDTNIFEVVEIFFFTVYSLFPFKLLCSLFCFWSFFVLFCLSFFLFFVFLIFFGLLSFLKFFFAV